MLLLGGFAGFALILAGLGVYAVISYSVSRRKQEIGIRMALGAMPREVRRSVIVDTLKLAGVGVVTGFIASWILGRLIQGLLFEVPSSDPATFAATVLILLSISALAGYLPARQASQLDPLEALRTE